MTTFVYIDWTTEDHPRPFYVGIGTKRRVSHWHRNNKHTGVMRKFGWRRDVVASVDLEEAKVREVELIAEHKTFHYDDPDGIGCNFTRGGEGTRGHPGSFGHLGKKHSEETKEIIRQKVKNQPRRKHSEESKKKIGDSHRGCLHSEESKLKMSRSLTGKRYVNRKSPKQFTDEHRKKIGEASRKRHEQRRQEKIEQDENIRS